MSTGNTCGECGAAIPADSPGSFCARCLLALGLVPKPGGAEQEGKEQAEAIASRVSPQGSAALSASVRETPGDRIGRYRLLEEIGHGGCGVVYMAEQQEPVRRKVALKVIKLGMDTRQFVARFEAERQALALMDHPNIAKVLDGGATEAGRPYFVMELVGGIKITDYCDQNHLSIRQRLDLFIQVCRALQHAHQKGVIHRDIKPSNVLVTTQDGAPVPKVIDFGIAKATQGRLTDQTLFTAFEQFLGTPAYMSPEQAQLGGLDVDTRSDIYSLGVLLYELLTGKTPFDSKELLAAGLEVMRHTICKKEPLTPSTRVKQELAARQAQGSSKSELANRHVQIANDLDWIVMKCLEKDRSRRYETANGLASDVQRHLNDEPVVARPRSKFYEFQKTVQRHRFGFAATVAIILVLTVGATVSTWQAVRATRAEWEQSRLLQQARAAQANEAHERRRAETEAARSQQVVRFFKDSFQSVDSSMALGRDTTMMREILDRTAKRMRNELTNQPEVEVDLGSTIAKVYSELSDLEQSEAMYRRLLVLQTNLFGAESTNVAASLAGVAGTLGGRKPEEAEKLARAALAIQRRVLGKESHDAVRTLNLLALILGNQGRWAEREITAREALEIERKLPGDEHRLLLSYVLHTLAYTLYADGRYAEAESPFREALLITREMGAVDQTMAHLLNNLALVLEGQGKLDEAESCFREALALRIQLFGNDHADVAISLANLAAVLEHQAESFGGVQRQSALAEAETLCRESLRIVRKKLPPDDGQLASTLSALAAVLIAAEKFNAAEPIARECLTIRERILPDDWRTSNIRSVLGASLLGQRRQAEAEPLLRSGYDGMRQREDAMPLRARPRLKEALQRLVAWCEVNGKSDEAARWKSELTKYYRKEVERLRGEAERGNLQSLNALAWLLAASPDPEIRNGADAVRFAQQAVEATSRKNPAFLNTLAAARAETGDFAGAVTAQQEAIALPQSEASKRSVVIRLKLYQSNTPYRQP